MPGTKAFPPKKIVEQIAAEHPTPFYVYHSEGIRNWCRDLQSAFSWNKGFRQYFAVKATPNPHIVRLVQEADCGADCSSLAELEICERLGIKSDHIIFTSNNTTKAEYLRAIELGAIVNLDTPDHLDAVLGFAKRPESISFRFNPGSEAIGNVLIGNPVESKFGSTRAQLLGGYKSAKNAGVTSLGLHAMIVSNELCIDKLIANVEMLFKLAVEIKNSCGVSLSFINLGGGIGIPYRPDQEPVNLAEFGKRVKESYDALLVPAGLGQLTIMMENGRAVTGPNGWLVTKVINTKQTYKKYIGVDACMSNLMRPGMYGAYHHVSLVGNENAPLTEVADVVGSLCENNDKFAIDREVPVMKVGDLVLIHDAGAHSHSMGFQYNGRLRSAEFLYSDDGTYRQIRRAETLADYFSTVDFSSLQTVG